MPLPGGPSDKFGNRYELWWTVSQFIRMLHGQAESIRIEDPGVTKAEFVIVSEGQRELHQAKRSNQDSKWSLASLASPDMEVLQTIFAELSGNHNRFVFVSGSDAGELRELVHRAESAQTTEEFESRFLDAKVQKANFEKLRKYWNNADVATVYEMLRRIEVRTIDERSLEEHVHWGARALFLSDPAIVCAELRCVAEDFVHQSITREALIERLALRGFVLRRLAKLDGAMALIDEATNRYLTIARGKLIGKALIPRSSTVTLLERIDGDAGGSEIVLTGKAGAGKTACVVECVEALRERGTPVLVFRLDRLEPVGTTVKLGQQLGLEESPVLVLAPAAAGRKAVLIIDQLDAVSTASGRSSDFLEAVEGLLAESRGVEDKLKPHVVVVCRAFDWENDHRLRRMLSEKHTAIVVAEFSPDEVKEILSAQGFDPGLFQKQQLELLRLPQNLSLFLDAGFDLVKGPQFNTAKELFDHYWDEKRRTVAARAAPLPEQWADIIQLLCDEMDRTQQLSVRREKLDLFAADYVIQMASEGVLTFDGQRYGFGHESFFDYCFARAFIAKEESLVTFLTASEQHLFRRSQVRQILAYLRDTDLPRYRKEIRALLTDSSVRNHVKDVVIAVVVSVTDPTDDEWAAIEPWLNSALEAFGNQNSSSDKLAMLVWQHFFGSLSWFDLADRRGLIAGWLASDKKGLVNMAVNYVRFHQRHAGDRVADMLEPYVGKGDEWKHRLRFTMEWADHGTSRRFFELFLRLIDDGTLDEARDRFASNGTFWSMLYGLAKARPEWVPEVIAHWLRRRLVLIQQKTVEGAEPEWHDLFGHDNFGAKHFHEAANSAPEAFVRHVLPVALMISDAAVYKGESSLPKRDSVWVVLHNTAYDSLDDACLMALVSALKMLVKTYTQSLDDVVTDLKRRDTYIANFLLLSLYEAGAAYFANEAVALLCDEPWRFQCGFSGSSYWVSMQLIRAITPVCSPENLAELQEAILAYSPDYEHTTNGFKYAGHACFTLLSAIPSTHCNTNAQARYLEFERKFGKPDAPPREIRAYTVGSPIKKDAAEKMTDEQWLKAVTKYNSEERPLNWNNPEKGGARQLAGMLREFVKSEPERFARLSLKFPLATNPAYIESTLDGLKDANAPTELKLAVCHKAYTEFRMECGSAIADLLGSIKEPLPDDAVQMLDWLATEHPDPYEELWTKEAMGGKPHYGGDILTHGINTTRGRTVGAIGDLIRTDAEYVRRFRTTLEGIVRDKSISVRSCVASTLLVVANHDTPLALELFDRLDLSDDRLLGTQYVDRFLYRTLSEHFTRCQPYIERMLRSAEPKASEAGARLASLGVLYGKNAAGLVKEAMVGSPSQRLGVAQVASGNIAFGECRAWAEEHLLMLFNDTDQEVRREVASCFRLLEGEPLEGYENLILAFCDSTAYQEDSFPILHTLEESLSRLPGITCVVCEKFLARFSDEAKDISKSRAGDVHMVVKLIFRTYHQHQRDEWAARCLDLIDLMCLEGIQDAKSGLDEYER